MEVFENLDLWKYYVTQDSHEDWEKLGKMLMEKKNFEQARYCFEKGGLEREREIAQAHLIQEAAVSAEQFQIAAQLFESSAAFIPLAGDHKELLLASARCYNRALNFSCSARMYHMASEYNKCVFQYHRASEMEKALEVINSHRNDIDIQLQKQVFTYFLDKLEYEYVLSRYQPIHGFLVLKVLPTVPS